MVFGLTSKYGRAVFAADPVASLSTGAVFSPAMSIGRRLGTIGGALLLLAPGATFFAGFWAPELG